VTEPKALLSLPDPDDGRKSAISEGLLRCESPQTRVFQLAPKQFRRATFPELQDAKEKLISVRTPGSEPKTIYENNSLYFDASSVGFVPWELLKNVINKSINKMAKYRHQDPLGDREKREEISQQFSLKYVLAIMNSSFAREWLKGKRRSKMHIYPDDWKKLPIAPIPLEAQKNSLTL
jgi:hypothetical protein